MDVSERRQPSFGTLCDPGSEAHGPLSLVGLLDSPPQESFDRVTRLTCRLLGTPVSVLRLFQGERQFLISHAGLREQWAPSGSAALDPLCRQVAATRAPVILPEIAPAGPSGPAAFAGAPLLLGEDCVGTLCVVERELRRWTEEDIATLVDLASVAAGALALRSAVQDRDRARSSLRASEDQMRLAFEAAHIGMVMIAVEGPGSGRMFRVNQAFCDFLGRSEASLIGAHIDEITHPEDVPRSHEALRSLETGESGVVRHLEKRYIHAEGHPLWGALTTSAVHPGDGSRGYAISLIEDITQRKQSEIDLPAIASVLRRILGGEDARGAIVKAAVDIAGASAAYLIERKGADRLTVTAATGLAQKGVEFPLSGGSASVRAHLSGEPNFVADAREDPDVADELLDLSGSASILWQPIFSHGEVIGVLLVCWSERVGDSSARPARAVGLLTEETAVALVHRDALQKLAAQAKTDGLTGLANRRAWDARLGRDLASARRLERPITLALLDMDRFKHYNDTHGHAAGDEFLRRFAARASVLLREGDTLARWGGEEFAILLPDCPSAGFVESILGRVCAAVPEGQSCSIGYASWDGRESPDELVARADGALYRAKAMGGDQALAAASGEDPSFPIIPLGEAAVAFAAGATSSAPSR